VQRAEGLRRMSVTSREGDDVDCVTDPRTGKIVMFDKTNPRGAWIESTHGRLIEP